jgi:hypothetical protein
MLNEDGLILVAMGPRENTGQMKRVDNMDINMMGVKQAHRQIMAAFCD